MQSKIFVGMLFTIWSSFFFLNDAHVTLIDKTRASDPTKREHFKIRNFKTYYPYGLNIEETYWRLLLCRTFARFCTFFWGIRVFYVKCTNASIGFEGTVLGQDYLDTDFEFLILLLVPFMISLFIILFIILFQFLFTGRTF